MKNYISYSSISNEQCRVISTILFLTIIFTFGLITQDVNAQKLLFPDEFKRLPESDPNAEITAKVLPNSNNKIFYGTIGSDNVMWVNGEPEKLDFPGKILSSNSDFTYVKGVISENESYYVFKDGEYTYININYAPGFSNLKVVYFSDDGRLIIGTARKSDDTYTRGRAVRITNGTWLVIGSDPPLSEWGDSNVSAVRGEDGSIIIGDMYIGNTNQGYRLENGTFQYISYQASITYARTASPDGNIVAGLAADVGLNNYIAYKWQNGNLTPLPELGGEFSYHYSSSVNNEGDIVTGYAELYTGDYSGNVAFIWTPDGGIRKFSEYISGEYEISFPGANVSRADLSEDKTYFSGTIQNADRSQRAYILLLNETDDRIVVNSTADRPLNVENSTDCNTGEQIEIDGKMVAECTLRAAIQAAINRFKEETGQSGKISFNIPGTDAHIIPVNSPLPDITAPLEIDGSDEISNTGLPLIYIDGQSAGGGVNGFNIMNDSVTLKKLAIYGFDGHGIYVADVEDIRLEGLIVGSDGNGTENIGNGNDGIHISGNAKIKVGGELMEASPLASGSFGTTVAVLGNKGNGISVSGTEVENLKSGTTSPFIFQTEEEMEKVFNNLTVGMIHTGDNFTKSIENLGAGVFLKGKNIIFDNSAFGASGGPAMEVVASESVHVMQTSFGKKKDEISEPGDVVNQKSGNLQKSINIQPFIKVLSSRGIMIGSTDASQSPVEAIGSQGFFMEVNNSEDVQVANVLSGTVKNLQNATANLTNQMKNILGGIKIENSERVTIGAKGVPTVIANSGDGVNAESVGILASGTLTKALKVISTRVGSVKELTFSGISGDGIRIENGIVDFTIGGDEKEEQVIIAGNGGYGLHLLNNNKNTIDPEILLQATAKIKNLITDLAEPGDEHSISPNKAGAIKINNSVNLLLEKLNIGPTEGHGIEITGELSESITVLSSKIGAITDTLSGEIKKIAGPAGDGIHIDGASKIQLGDDSEENGLTILGSIKKGISIIASNSVSMNHVHVGKTSLVGGLGGVIDAIGNKLGGVYIDSSDSIGIFNSFISNNGSVSPESTGGLTAKFSGLVQVFASEFGTTSETGEPQGNHGAAIEVEGVEKLMVSASKLTKNMSGIIAKTTNVVLEGNRIEEQTGGNGKPGNGVEIQSGFLNAGRNIIAGNSGTGISLSNMQSSIIRVNNIISNLMGALTVETDSEAKSGQANGSLIYAGENWWGNASGPGGEGPGTGDAVNGNVVYSNWLSAPIGLAIVPQEHLISLKSNQECILPVSVANHMDASDQLNITITDSLGWYSGNSMFSVPVENFEYNTISLAFHPTGSQSNINMAKIKAVSQNNQDLTTEVIIYFVPEHNIINLENPSMAETNILDTESGPFQIGDEIIIGHGLANEETGIITDFGSIILENPLKFSHAPGERIFTITNLYTSVNEIIAEIPDTQKTILGNNFPNPFAASTKIPFEITETGKVEVLIIDNLGRTVKSLVNQTLPAGKHEVTFEGASIPEGMYFYQIRGNGFSETRKMVKIAQKI
jgi:CSLREA domain-containing protein